jgi:2-C-methyl-D-erythritol 4-phosphate cytidylyltransferase
MMNVAIIVAGGSGKRFGSEIPKQFLKLGGKPLIFHTLEKFENCPAIDEIILVLASDKIGYFYSLPEKSKFKKPVKIVAGGKIRAESVLNGLKAISENCQIVVVHDGARPFVSGEEISQTVAAAQAHGAACLTAKITDTVKEISPSGKIIGTINREKLRRALTPQAFHFEILQKAFAENDLKESVTDECLLVEKLGYPIFAVEGNPKNIKITTREDFLLAEILLKS